MHECEAEFPLTSIMIRHPQDFCEALDVGPVVTFYSSKYRARYTRTYNIFSHTSLKQMVLALIEIIKAQSPLVSQLPIVTPFSG